MTRMIERWFPGAEVSENSDSGWGSGNLERNLFTWFAARPTAQAKAAVICSLLPWPDDQAEQNRLQMLVREAMTGRYEAKEQLQAEILLANPGGSSILDPFSGRGMIPLESSRLGLGSFAIDYSPVAVLASQLLTDYPFRNWSDEPTLPFASSGSLVEMESRLVRDVDAVLSEIGHRYEDSMAPFYPRVNGRLPWGYLWAVTLPCQECGRRFPLISSLTLRAASAKSIRSRTNINDKGQSFYLLTDQDSGLFEVVIHEGPPKGMATLASGISGDGSKIPGKSAICPFCGHLHPLAVHRRLANEGQGKDVLLLVSDHDPVFGKVFRTPTPPEVAAAERAKATLNNEPPFSPVMPAVPNEAIAPGNNNIIGPSIYGARTYGDLCVPRQTLAYVRLCRVIADLGSELIQRYYLSPDYARALVGYAGSTMVRKLRYSTRGAWLRSQANGAVSVAGIFVNEGSLTFSYDNFEVGLGEGGGSWRSSVEQTLRVLKGLTAGLFGTPATISRGSATDLPFSSNQFAAVVTDPPYDEMIAYCDSSDLFFAWLKRLLSTTDPAFGVTADPYGGQEKKYEIIVKRARGLSRTDFNEHRTRSHYDSHIAQAFAEMNRVVRTDGIVTIVFGHGEPEVWQRLLKAIEIAGLVMTGSWPARTESGGQQNKANIETTLTMACRPAGSRRPQGHRAAVESEIRSEIRRRYADWERWGLAPTDMLMAAAGPAMEIVGRYSEVLDARGEPVAIDKFLPLARAAVQEAMAVEIDHHPLETFDARTRFALWWVRLFGRGIAAKSELRWQALAASLDLSEVRDLVPDADKGCQLVTAARHRAPISPDSSVIDVVLALARTSEEGLGSMGDVLVSSARAPDDAYLWAATKFMADRLPESDPDAIALTRVIRNRAGVGNAAQAVKAASALAVRERDRRESQMELL